MCKCPVGVVIVVVFWRQGSWRKAMLQHYSIAGIRITKRAARHGVQLVQRRMRVHGNDGTLFADTRQTKRKRSGARHVVVVVVVDDVDDKVYSQDSKVGCVLTPHAASGKQGGKGKSRLQPWRLGGR
jgi:hypothetical protein